MPSWRTWWISDSLCNYRPVDFVVRLGSCEGTSGLYERYSCNCACVAGCNVGCNMWATTAGLQHLVAVSSGSVRGCHYEVFTIEGVTPVDVNVHL